MKKSAEFLDIAILVLYIYIATIGIIKTGISKENAILIIYSYFSIRIFYSMIIKKITIDCSKLISIFLFYSLLSTLWSSDIIESFYRAVMNLIYPTIIIFFFISKYDYKKTFSAFIYAGIIVSITSLIYIYTNPMNGISINGEWKGVFIHKNPFGFFILLCGALSILAFYNTKNYWLKVLFSSLFLSYVYILFKSQSTTNMIILLIVVLLVNYSAIFYLVKNIWLKMFSIVVSLVFFLLLVYLASMNSGVIFRIFGKDTTLSGRTDIWSAIFSIMNGHWLLGYGFDSFWLPEADSKKYLDYYMSTDVPHAHNNYIDIISNLGVAGLIILFGILILFLKHSVNIVKNSNSIMSYFPILFLIIMIIHQMSESYLVRPGIYSNVWCLFVLLYMHGKLTRNKLIEFKGDTKQ